MSHILAPPLCLSFEVSPQALQTLIPVTQLLSLLDNSRQCQRLIAPGHSAAPFKDAAGNLRLFSLFSKCEPLQDPNNNISKNTSAMTIHRGVNRANSSWGEVTYQLQPGVGDQHLVLFILREETEGGRKKSNAAVDT